MPWRARHDVLWIDPALTDDDWMTRCDPNAVHAANLLVELRSRRVCTPNPNHLAVPAERAQNVADLTITDFLGGPAFQKYECVATPTRPALATLFAMYERTDSMALAATARAETPCAVWPHLPTSFTTGCVTAFTMANFAATFSQANKAVPCRHKAKDAAIGQSELMQCATMLVNTQQVRP